MRLKVKNDDKLDKSIVSESMYAISGILILIVVYLHLLSGFGYVQRPILRIPVEVFGFFMAWFYYKSGGGIIERIGTCRIL